MSINQRSNSKLAFDCSKYFTKDHLFSTPKSDKTCSSIKSLKKVKSCYSSEFIQSTIIKECLKTEFLMIETQHLADTVNCLQKSFEKNRKIQSRSYSIDFYMNDDSFRSDDTIVVLRDQVDLAKSLEKNERVFSERSFDDSIESFQVIREDIRKELKDFRCEAFLKSIALLKFNLG